jgi:hypothetical protein
VSCWFSGVCVSFLYEFIIAFSDVYPNFSTILYAYKVTSNFFTSLFYIKAVLCNIFKNNFSVTYSKVKSTMILFIMIPAFYVGFMSLHFVVKIKCCYGEDKA